MEFKRFENESDDELIFRICSEKERIGTWVDVCDILNELTGNDYNESAYRKKFQIFNKMLDANENRFSNINTQVDEIKELKRQLEVAKIQYRDERNAWNKQNYTSARVGQKLDYLEEELVSIGKELFDISDSPAIDSDNDMLIILSDLHIGQTFSSSWGEYNTDIAKERLEKYISEIKRIQKIHNSQNAYVSIQGDLISGSIHKALAITNRENVIEQIKIAAQLIISFCDELRKDFNHVYISNVSGNHSRIDKKEDALHDERLDDLIGWIIENTMSHIDNITFLREKVDIGISKMDIRGKIYVNVHGDSDSFNKTGVSNLCMMLGFMPYAITYGHLHVCSMDECSGIKMIRGGSLAGSGDSYTIEKRLVGKPSQMVCICNQKGIDCCYPIELN